MEIRRGDDVAILTDGGQDAGLAVLINSLVRSGFRATVWVGWRGQGARLFERLPATVSRLLTFELIELDTARPLAFYKPDFLSTVWARRSSGDGAVIYMDCDIIVACDWDLIAAWVTSGIAVVEDLPHRPIGVDHPLRSAWLQFMSAAGVPPKRTIGAYFNSGFVAIPSPARPILPIWSRLGEAIEGVSWGLDNGHTPHYMRGIRAATIPIDVTDNVRALMRPFLLEDQDALNMAIMASDVPLSPMGPDAMGFTTSRTPILLHALGPEKPWDVSYLRRLARSGRGPSFADDMWWTYSDAPIPVRTWPGNRGRRWSWRLAKALGRFS